MTEQDKSRAAFEAWAKDQGYQRDELERSTLSLVSPEYFNLNTEMAWKAWQAARALPADVAPGWLPIESAPKDGTYVLLWEQYGTNPFVGYWWRDRWSVSHEHVDAEGGWDGANVVDAISMPVTHWMPLPAAPDA